MHFSFPDVADFPENEGPAFEGEFIFDGDFYSEAAALIEFVRARSTFSENEQRIFDKQLSRIKVAADSYFGLRNWEPVFRYESAYTGALRQAFEAEIEELRDAEPAMAVNEVDRAVVVSADPVAEFLDGLGIRGRVQSAVLQISRPGDRHHYQQFADCETTTKLLNLHMDPKPGRRKVLIYLNEVGPDNGPFQCIPESLDWEYDEIERIFAWGNSVGNYCHTPLHRRVANAFPKRFRKSAIIGRLIPDGTPLSDFLLRKLKTITSDVGNVIYFDPCFMFHRGGLCKEGERINLQVVLA